MKQDETNTKVHAALKEYARKYFDAVIKRNTNTDGECWLKPGNYSVNDLADHRKANCGMYATPDEREFKQDITISVNTFECVFPYDKIFLILARWESMAKLGKGKAVFEIGDVEERSAKVLQSERTPSGELKFKTIKMVRLVGNWWMPKRVAKLGPTNLIYDLNGICFYPGAQIFHSNLQDKRENAELKERWGRIADARIIELLGKAIQDSQDAQGDVYFDYWRKVAELAGIEYDADKDSATQSETAEISTDAEKVDNLPTESENASKSNETTEIADIDTLPTVAEYDAAQKHFADSEADALANAESERVWETSEDAERVRTNESEPPTAKAEAVAAPSVSPTNAVDLVAPPTTERAKQPGKHTTTAERVRTEFVTAYLLVLALFASIWPYKPPLCMQVEDLPPNERKRTHAPKKRQIWNVCRPRPLRPGVRPIFSGVLAPPGSIRDAVAALANSRMPKAPPQRSPQQRGRQFAPT